MEQTSLPAERQQRLLQMAQRQQVVRVTEAAQSLNVHEMTIRRDLDALAEQGLLERVHGGARLLQAGLETSFQLRSQELPGAKARIAEAALAFVQDGDTVAVDASTTGLALVRLLRGRNVKAVITNLEAATLLADSGTPFILVGGSFHAKSYSFVGPLAGAVLSKLNPDTVFFSAKGFTLETGFTDAYAPEAELKERLIRSSGRAVALLDQGKFGLRALHSFATPADVDALITDAPLDAALSAAFERSNVSVTVAGSHSK